MVHRATAWGGALAQGGYDLRGCGLGGYGAAMAQGATGLRKTSRKSYGKLGLRNARIKKHLAKGMLGLRNNRAKGC